MTTGAQHMQMNTVIHSGLRRDLSRLQAVLKGPLGDQQRSAVTRFIPWMMRMLHHHHVGEDEGMWPRALAKRPDLADLAQETATEHQTIVEASDRLVAAAATYGATGTDDDRQALRDAVAAMHAATIPHLDHEERDVAPVIAQVLDPQDWKYLEKNYYNRGMSPKDVVAFLLWTMDDANPENAAAVRSQVSGGVMWVLYAGFGGRYDREARRRWGPLAGRRA